MNRTFAVFQKMVFKETNDDSVIYRQSVFYSVALTVLCARSMIMGNKTTSVQLSWLHRDDVLRIVAIGNDHMDS